MIENVDDPTEIKRYRDVVEISQSMFAGNYDDLRNNRKIETEHNKINGTPTTLEINLYYSAWLIRYGEKPFKTVVFEYD
jgi:hypothetical protein